MLIILTILYSIFLIIPSNNIEINFVDVGQGDCAHIKTSKGHNALIDCGGSEGSDYDVGKNILLPYLLNNSNGVIDAIFISHFHDDHAEGCIEIIKSLKVKKIFISPQNKETLLLNMILSLAKEKSIPVIYVKNGDLIEIDNAKFEILFNGSDLDSNIDLNNKSMIIKLIAHDTSILFTGDAERIEEELLLENRHTRVRLNSDILKVGHHGSRSSTTADFLNIVSPKIAIISCGVDNKFKHPHSETIEKLDNYNAKIYRTDLSGEISLKVYPNNKIKIQRIVL